MEYTDETIAKMQSLGALGYGVEKIINILDIPETDAATFRSDFANTDSPIRRAYQKGVDKSDYIIDKKLYELAQTGDLKAIETYENKKMVNRQNQED